MWRCRFTPAQISVGVGVAATALAAGVAAAKDPDVADMLYAPVERLWDHAQYAVPPLRTHPKLTVAAIGTLSLAGALYYRCDFCACIVFSIVIYVVS